MYTEAKERRNSDDLGTDASPHGHSRLLLESGFLRLLFYKAILREDALRMGLNNYPVPCGSAVPVVGSFFAQARSVEFINRNGSNYFLAQIRLKW